MRSPPLYVESLIERRREESNAQVDKKTVRPSHLSMPDDGITYVQRRILKVFASIVLHGPHLESMARPTTDDGDQDGVAAEGGVAVAAGPGLHLQVPHGDLRRRNRRPVLDRRVVKDRPL